MSEHPTVSVVVPTRNEADNVPVLLERVFAALDGVDAEVCVVDDSDDHTPDVLRRLAEGSQGRIRCLLRAGPDRAGGLSTAVVTGLRMARGRWVCVMDADLQHPPETIPGMLQAAQAGADLVVASRYVPGGSHGGLDGTTRRLVSRAATGLARLLFREARRTADPLSGFFLCRRELTDGIEFRPVGFKILLELLVLLPDVEVRDVPLRFQRREAGSSKASLRQGLLYLRHLRSLVVDVEGSARFWKFAAVGASGLLIYLPVLWLLVSLGLPTLLAFLPAFALSLGWNTAINRLVTFPDLRRRHTGEGPGDYLRRSLASGLVMFGAFAALVASPLHPVVAGLFAALAGMVVNGVLNRRLADRAPLAWSRVATDRGVQEALRRLAAQIGADRAVLLPASSRMGEAGAVPPDVLARVAARRRPVLLTEGPSFRAQRRTNIEALSVLVVPVVRDEAVVALVVCERRAPRGFEPVALETATQAVEALGALVAGADPSATPLAAAAG